MNIEMLSPIPEPPSIELLWKSNLSSTTFGPKKVSLDLKKYSAVGIAFKYHYDWKQIGCIQVEIGDYIGSMIAFDIENKSIMATRQATVTTTGVQFTNCKDWDGNTNNAKCYPFKIYGIRA